MLKEFEFDVRETSINYLEICRKISLKVNHLKDCNCIPDNDLLRVNHYFLSSIKDKDQYLEEISKVLDSAWNININDFEIVCKKRNILGLVEYLIKKVIWKLLKFYTFQIFSQQINYNKSLSQSILSTKNHYLKKISNLEEKFILLTKEYKNLKCSRLK